MIHTCSLVMYRLVVQKKPKLCSDLQDKSSIETSYAKTQYCDIVPLKCTSEMAAWSVNTWHWIIIFKTFYIKLPFDRKYKRPYPNCRTRESTVTCVFSCRNKMAPWLDLRTLD